MINDIIFLKKSSGYRGTPIGSFKTISAKDFMIGMGYSKNRNDILYAFKENSSLMPISQMSLKVFESVFSKEDIMTMATFGVLSYYPNANWAHKKYPMFKKEIYQKYGLKEVCKEDIC